MLKSLRSHLAVVERYSHPLVSTVFSYLRVLVKYQIQTVEQGDTEIGQDKKGYS